MLFSTIPVAILFAGLFSIPKSLHGIGLLAYVILCSTMLRMGLSLFNLPYIAVGAEVTDDYRERSSIVSYRLLFLMAGTFCAIALGLGVFMAGPSGLLDRHAYVPFAWTCAGLIVAAGLTGSLATNSVLARLHAPSRTGKLTFRQFPRELFDLFQNRSFLVLFTATLVFFVAQGVSGALTLYLNRYFWNLSPAALQLIIVGVTLGPFAGAPLNALLTRFIEKRTLTIGNFVLFALCQFWPPIIHLAGYLPGTGPAVVGALFGNALVTGAALLGGAVGFQSMMADAADEHEFSFGVRREGLFFSGLTLAVKAASGLGGFIAGMALDLIHFPTAIAATHTALHLPPSVMRNLGLIAGPLPAAITLLAPIVLLAYSLSRKKHAVILAELENRRRV